MNIVKRLIAIALVFSISVDPVHAHSFHTLAPMGMNFFRVLENLFVKDELFPNGFSKKDFAHLASSITSLTNTAYDVSAQYDHASLKNDLNRVAAVLSSNLTSSSKKVLGELIEKCQIPQVHDIDSLSTLIAGYCAQDTLQFSFLIPKNKTPFFGFVNKKGKPVKTDSYEEKDIYYFSAPQFNALARGSQIGLIIGAVVKNLLPETPEALAIADILEFNAGLVFDTPRLSQDIFSHVKQYIQAKHAVLDAARNDDWVLYKEKRTDLVHKLDAVYPAVKEFSPATMEYIFNKISHDTDMPEFLFANPLEIHHMRTPDFDDKARQIIQSAAQEVCEELFDDEHEQQIWTDTLRSSVLPWRLEYMLPEEIPAVYASKKSDFVVQTIMDFLPSLSQAGGFFHFASAKNYFPEISDPIDFKFCLKHEFVHFLAHHNIMHIPAEFEFITTAVHILEIANQLGEDNISLYQDVLQSPVMSDLYQEGKRIAREGLIGLFVEQKDSTGSHYINIKFLEERVRTIYRKNNVPLASLAYNERMEREVGVMFAGIIAQNHERSGASHLKILKNLLDALYSRCRPPSDEEKRWALTKLLPRLQYYAQFASGCATVRMQEADTRQGLGFWQFSHFSAQLGIQTYMPYDLYPRDYDGVTDELRKSKTADRAFGHLFQSIYRTQLSRWNSAQKKLTLPEDEEKRAEVLWHVLETPYIIREGLKNNQHNITDFGDFDDARGAGRWIRLVFESRYHTGSKEEAETLLSMRPLHLQYLDSLLYRWIFAQTDPEDGRLINTEVKNAVLRTQEAWINLFSKQDITEQGFYDLTFTQVWPEYKKLYKKAEEDQIQRRVYEQMETEEEWPGSYDALPDEQKEAIQKQWNSLTPEEREAIQNAVKQAMREALEEFLSGMGTSTQQQGEQIPEPMPGMVNKPQQASGSGSARQSQSFGDFKNQLNALNSMISDMEKDIDSIQQQASDISSDTRGLAQDGKEIHEQAGSTGLEGKTKSLSDNVSQLQKKARKLRDKGVDFNRSAEQTHRNITDKLSDPEKAFSIEQMAEHSEDVDQNSDNLKDQIAELEKRINELKNKADALHSSVKEGDDTGTVSSRAGRVRESVQDVKQTTDEVSETTKKIQEMLGTLKNISEKLAAPRTPKPQSQPLPGSDEQADAGGEEPASSAHHKFPGLNDMVGDQAPVKPDGTPAPPQTAPPGMPLQTPRSSVSTDNLLKDIQDAEEELTIGTTNLSGTDLQKYLDLIKENNNQIKYFRKKFKRLLCPDEMDEEDPGYSSGARLDDPVDAITGVGGFIQYTELIPHGMRVSIGVDTSQSMSYNDGKRIEAARTAVIIALGSLLPLIIELKAFNITLEVEVFHFNDHIRKQSKVLLTYEESKNITSKKIPNIIYKKVLSQLAPIQGASSKDEVVLAQMRKRGIAKKPSNLQLFGIWLGDGNFGNASETMQKILKEMKKDNFPIVGGALGDPEQYDFMKKIFGERETVALDLDHTEKLAKDIMTKSEKVLSPLGRPLWTQWLASFWPLILTPLIGLLELANQFVSEVTRIVLLDTSVAPEVVETLHPDFEKDFNFYIRQEGNKQYLVHKNKHGVNDVMIEYGPGGERVPLTTIPHTETNEKLLVEILQFLYPYSIQEHTSVSSDQKYFMKSKINAVEIWNVEEQSLTAHLRTDTQFWQKKDQTANVSKDGFFMADITHRTVSLMKDEKVVCSFAFDDDQIPDVMQRDEQGWIYALFGNNGGANRVVIYEPDEEGSYHIKYDMREEKEEEIKVLNLEGEGGVGKGELVKSAYHLLNRPLAQMSAHEGMRKEDFFSRVRIDADGDLFSTEEELSPLSIGSEFGWGVFIDEFNKTKESERGSLMDLFQERTYEREGMQYPMHPHSRIIVAGNPEGLHDIVPFNSAERKRMKTIYVPWQSPEEELKILKYYAFKGRRLSQSAKDQLETQFKNLIKIADTLRLLYMGYDNETGNNQIQKILDDWTLMSDDLKRAEFLPAFDKGTRMKRPPSPRVLVNIAVDMAAFPSYAQYRPWSIINRMFNFYAETAPAEHQELVDTMFKQVFENVKNKQGEEVVPHITVDDVKIKKTLVDNREIKVLCIQPPPTVFTTESDSRQTIEWDPVEVIMHPDALDHLDDKTRTLFETPSLAFFIYEFLQDRMPLLHNEYGRDYLFVGVSDTNKSWITKLIQQLLCGPEIFSITYHKGTRAEAITVKRGIKKGRTTWIEYPLILAMGNREQYLKDNRAMGKIARCSETNQANPRILSISSEISQNRRCLLPDNTEVAAGPGFGTIDNINTPGSRSGINEFSPEYLERRVIYQLGFYKPEEEIDILFKTAEGKVSRKFLGEWDDGEKKWKGLIAVILRLREISIEKPEVLDRSPGLSVTKDFVRMAAKYFETTQEKPDDFILRQFLASYNIDQKNWMLVKNVFKEHGLWNDTRTAIETYLDGEPLITEGLSILKEPEIDDDIGFLKNILIMLQLTTKSPAIPEKIAVLYKFVQDMTAQYKNDPITKKLTVPFTLIEIYQIVQRIIAERDHITANKEKLNEINTRIEEFFKAKEWHESILEPSFDHKKLKNLKISDSQTGDDRLDEYFGLLQIFNDKDEYVKQIAVKIAEILKNHLAQCKGAMLHECIKPMAVMRQTHYVIEAMNSPLLNEMTDILQRSPFPKDEQDKLSEPKGILAETINAFDNMFKQAPKPRAKMVELFKGKQGLIQHVYRYYIAQALKIYNKGDERQHYIDKALYVHELWEKEIIPSLMSEAKRPGQSGKKITQEKIRGVSLWLQSLPDDSELPMASPIITAPDKFTFIRAAYSPADSLLFVTEDIGNENAADHNKARIRVYDYCTMESIAESPVFDNMCLYSLDVSHDGRFLVMGSINQKKLMLFELKNAKGELKDLNNLLKSKPYAQIVCDGGVWNTTFSHDDTYLAVGAGKKALLYKIKKKNMQYKSESRILKNPIAQSPDMQRTVTNISFSPEDRFLAIGYFQGRQTSFFEMKDSEGKEKEDESTILNNPVAEIPAANGLERSSCFSPDGRFLFVGTSDHKIKVYELKNEEGKYKNLAEALQKPIAESPALNNIAHRLLFTADGTHLIAGMDSHNVWVYELKDENGDYKDFKKVLEKPKLMSMKNRPETLGGSIADIALSPYNTHLSVLAGNKHHVWDKIEEEDVPTGTVSSAEKNKSISAWLDSLIPEPSATKPAELPPADVVKEDASADVDNGDVSFNGLYIAAGDQENHLRIYNTETKQCIVDKILDNNIAKIRFSPDGQLLIIATYDGGFHKDLFIYKLTDEKSRYKDLREVFNNDPLVKKHDYQGRIYDICFAENNEALFIITGDKRLWIYDLKDNEGKYRDLAMEFHNYEEPDPCDILFTSVAVDPKCHNLALGTTHDNKIRFYQLTFRDSPNGKEYFRIAPPTEIDIKDKVENNEGIWDLKFSPNSEFLVGHTRFDQKVILLRVQNAPGEYRTKQEIENDLIVYTDSNSLEVKNHSFSHDSRFLCICLYVHNYKGKFQVVELKTKEGNTLESLDNSFQKPVITKEFTGIAWKVLFSEDDSTFALTENHKVNWWRKTGQKKPTEKTSSITEWIQSLQKHELKKSELPELPYPDKVRSLHASTKSEATVFTRDRSLQAQVRTNGKLIITDLDSGTELLYYHLGDNVSFTACCFTSDARYLFAGYICFCPNEMITTKILVIELKDKNGVLYENITVPDNTSAYVMPDDIGEINSLDISSDDSLLAVGASGQYGWMIFRLKDIKGDYIEFSISLKEPDDKVGYAGGSWQAVKFSPDAKFLTGSRIYDEQNCMFKLASLKDKDGRNYSLGSKLTNSKRQLQENQEKQVTEVCFRPQGDLMIALRKSGEVYMKFLADADGKYVDTVGAFDALCERGVDSSNLGNVHGMAFSADGSLFAIGIDNFACIYPVDKSETGLYMPDFDHLIAVLPPLDGDIQRLEFSKEGHSFLAVTKQKSYLWTTKEIIAFAEKTETPVKEGVKAISIVDMPSRRLLDALWKLLTIKKATYVEESAEVVGLYTEQYKGDKWFKTVLSQIKTFQGKLAEKLVKGIFAVAAPQLAFIYKITGFLAGLGVGAALMVPYIGWLSIPIAAVFSLFAMMAGYVLHEIGHVYGGVLGGPLMSMIIAVASFVNAVIAVQKSSTHNFMLITGLFIACANYVVHMFADHQILFKEIGALGKEIFTDNTPQDKAPMEAVPAEIDKPNQVRLIFTSQ